MWPRPRARPPWPGRWRAARRDMSHVTCAKAHQVFRMHLYIGHRGTQVTMLERWVFKWQQTHS